MVTENTFNPFIAVYILASQPYGTLYVGVTSDLPGRILKHRNGTYEGFSKKYDVHRLVWYELHPRMLIAIQREKTIKKYKRDWKINLIEADNPHWEDLYPPLINRWRKEVAAFNGQIER